MQKPARMSRLFLFLPYDAVKFKINLTAVSGYIFREIN